MVAIGLLLVCLAGCGGQDPTPYVNALREQQMAYVEMSKLLSAISDEKTMADAKSAFQAKFQTFEEIADRAKKLPPPADATKAELEKHRAGLARNIETVREHIRRIRRIPGGEAFFDEYRKQGISLFQD